MATEKPIPSRQRDPWSKGHLIGQKRPLKPKDVCMIRVRPQMEERRRDLAMFNLAIDSKLRGCDLVRLRIDDVFVGGRVRVDPFLQAEQGNAALLEHGASREQLAE